MLVVASGVGEAEGVKGIGAAHETGNCWNAGMDGAKGSRSGMTSGSGAGGGVGGVKSSVS